MSEWINITDELPTIPEGRNGIILDVWATFNLNGEGTRFTDACYEYRTSNKPGFHGNGCSLREFTVTHFMIPSPPKDK